MIERHEVRSKKRSDTKNLVSRNKILKILILANDCGGLYNFRKEVIKKLLEKNQVFTLVPKNETAKKLENLGCNVNEISLERRGTNPLKDLKLIVMYFKFLKKTKPDVVLTYTIKPNIYGGIVCELLKTPYIGNITGLGTAVENKGLIQKLTIFLYRVAFRKIGCLFFQNKTNMQFFKEKNIVVKNQRLLPGSGVNLSHFKILPYPLSEETLSFVFIARVMEAKGINEYLEAAKAIKKKHPKVTFHICGFCEDGYAAIMEKANDEGIVIYHGSVDDIREILKTSHCTILPSYHEGMANVLLESAASGRPVLASNIPGCKETFKEGVTGLGFESKNTESLIEAIEKFIELSYEVKKEMGLAGRKHVEENFDRQIVVDAYLEEIKKIEEDKQSLRK